MVWKCFGNVAFALCAGKEVAQSSNKVNRHIHQERLTLREIQFNTSTQKKRGAKTAPQRHYLRVFHIETMHSGETHFAKPCENLTHNAMLLTSAFVPKTTG